MGSHVYGWLGGTLLSIVLLVGQTFCGWQPSKFHFVGILGLGISWSMFAAWRDERDARLKAETLHGNRPDIHGDVLAVFWDFVTINKKTGLNLLDIFVRLRLVNHEDIGTTTKESRLQIEFNGEHYEAMGESPGLGKIVHESSYRDEFTTGEADCGEGFGVVTRVVPFYPHIPLQISVEQKGWIKFRIHGDFKDQARNCSVDVTIIDSLGGNHSIHGKDLSFNVGRFNA